MLTHLSNLIPLENTQTLSHTRFPAQIPHIHRQDIDDQGDFKLHRKDKGAFILAYMNVSYVILQATLPKKNATYLQRTLGPW